MKMQILKSVMEIVIAVGHLDTILLLYKQAIKTKLIIDLVELIPLGLGHCLSVVSIHSIG